MNQPSSAVPQDSVQKGTPPEICAPSITFKSVTFSDGTTIELNPTDIVVFVGPNNAGKSLALRELEAHIGRPPPGRVIKSVELRKSGTAEELGEYLEKNSRLIWQGSEQQYVGYKYSLPSRNIPKFWNGDVGPLRAFFCMRIPTESRITDSNASPAIQVLTEPASHPIQMLFSKDKIETRISGYFHRAFGKDLTVFRLGGNSWPLLVGDRLEPRAGEDRVSSSYNDRLLESTDRLQEQGDGMRSFASVILHLLAPITGSIRLTYQERLCTYAKALRTRRLRGWNGFRPVGGCCGDSVSPRFVRDHGSD